VPADQPAVEHDFRVSDGGVLYLREKTGGGIHILAPHTWTAITLPRDR
jgi:hypothetical protein